MIRAVRAVTHSRARAYIQQATALQVIRADSREVAETIVDTFPMAPYSAIVITPLAEPQAIVGVR